MFKSNSPIKLKFKSLYFLYFIFFLHFDKNLNSKSLKIEDVPCTSVFAFEMLPSENRNSAKFSCF